MRTDTAHELTSNAASVAANLVEATRNLNEALERLSASLPKGMADRGQFDIAVRSHFAPLPDSDLVARELRRDPFVLVASPDYLVAKGAPATPEELADHDGLLSRPDATVWRLQGPDGQTVEVEPRPRFIADESTGLLEAAKAGLGIAVLPTYARAVAPASVVARPLAEPSIARDIVMIRPSGRSVSPGLSAFETLLRRFVRQLAPSEES